MGGVCTGPGPCDTSVIGMGKNWVTKVGGLPLYIRAIAQALIRSGHSESQAIQLAVGTVQNWARGGGKVKPETRARAAAALAEWEAKKAAAHATSVPAGERQMIDLAQWNAAAHPRSPAGTSAGGKFAAKSGNSSQSGNTTPADVAAQIKDFQKRQGLAQTGRFDSATSARIKAVKAAKSGGGGGGGGGSAGKKAASAQAAAAKKAMAAHAKAVKQAAAAKAKAAKLLAANQKKAAAAQLKLSKAHTAAAAKAAQTTATAVNSLTPAQRAAYRSNSPKPPAGYAWTSAGKLAPTATVTAAAQAAAVAAQPHP